MSDEYFFTAISGKCENLANNNLRLVVEIEEKDAKAAYEEFGKRGTPMIVSRMSAQAGQETMQKAAVDADKKPLGQLCRWAARFCCDKEFKEDFWQWLSDTGTETVMDSEQAKEVLLRRVSDEVGFALETRHDLDDYADAGNVFRTQIMQPFHAWREMLKANG